MNRSATSASACTPRPSRSSIRNSKPPVVPSPWIGGGGKTRARASVTSAAELLLEPGHQGPGPQLGLLALLPVLEDDVDGAAVGLVHLSDRVVGRRTGSCRPRPPVFSAICSTRSMTREVGSWVVPSGVWTVTMRYPWSSTGMNDLGRSMIIQAVSASRAERGDDDRSTSGGRCTRGTSRRSSRATSFPG